MTGIKSLWLYCGSSEGRHDRFRGGGAALGALLAERGIRLVYGGGHVGLMGIAADAALAKGGTVIGVIPKFLLATEAGHSGVTELMVVGSMHERKQRMFELADGFVVLPGGLGTMAETIEIVPWKQLGLHDKPIVLLDLDGYWGAWIGLVDKAIAAGFAKPQVTALFTAVRSLDELLPALEP